MSKDPRLSDETLIKNERALEKRKRLTILYETSLFLSSFLSLLPIFYLAYTKGHSYYNVGAFYAASILLFLFNTVLGIFAIKKSMPSSSPKKNKLL